jgi:glycosyltransferase involved in cell wall biosynthesis
MGRVALGRFLVGNLLQKKYTRVLCGHILLTPLIFPFCKHFKVPMTLMTYGKEVWNPVTKPQQNALQGADQIWTISRHTRDLACVANNLRPDKFCMVPCIVEGNTFTPGPKNSDLTTKYGLYDCRVLMTVARLWSGDIYKGVDITIRALPDILAVMPQVKYLVIGRGDDQPRLAQLAVDLGVRDRVIFAGFVPNEVLVDHYRLADAYVMPSREGFGIVYLEAMACGVPVVSGDDDGSADPLQDGRVGWRVPYRDPQAVAQACIEILKGDDVRCDGAWLREQTLARFSPSSLQAQIGELLLTQELVTAP